MREESRTDGGMREGRCCPLCGEWRVFEVWAKDDVRAWGPGSPGCITYHGVCEACGLGSFWEEWDEGEAGDERSSVAGSEEGASAGLHEEVAGEEEGP